MGDGFDREVRGEQEVLGERHAFVEHVAVGAQAGVASEEVVEVVGGEAGCACDGFERGALLMVAVHVGDGWGEGLVCVGVGVGGLVDGRDHAGEDVLDERVEAELGGRR